MSLLCIHLCWDDAGPRQHAGLRQLLPPVRLDDRGPCLHRRTWLAGDRVLGVEVWSDDDAASRHLADLPANSRAAGLEAPTVVVLVWPDVYRALLPGLLGPSEAEAAEPAGRSPAAPAR
ncbi:MULTISPECIES: hypothetical protein [unclassified Geodermatophilus]